ncbi:MAG: hypothetical protein JNK04_00580, partial [Myxococcales bacterium]|nr:hypothetical protein [Myxococcales bacterium]
MKVASVLGWLSACALGAVALAPSGCTCTEVGCWGSVSTTLMVQGDIESLEDAIVTICRGESCAEGRLVPASDGKQLTCDFGDGAATGERGCQASTEGDEVAV